MNKKKTGSKFWDNKIVWAILAIIASVVLWVYVTMTEGDLVTKTFNGVVVEFTNREALRDERELIITDISSATVSVSLRGTRRELSNISSDSLTAVIDASKTPLVGTHTTTPTIVYAAGVSNSTITSVTVSPTTVVYTVVRETSWTVPVEGRLNGSVAEGYSPSSPVYDPVSVILRGPEDEVRQVEKVWVDINHQDLDTSLDYYSSYILLDQNGDEVPIGNIELDTDRIHVMVQVSATKEVALTVTLIDGGGAKAENTIVKCEPETITVSGDKEDLEALNSIELATIDLSTISSSFEQTYTISPPNDITNVTGTPEAKVTIQIIGLVTKTFNVTNIVVTNVTEGYKAEILTESLEVTLRGPKEVLDEIRPNNIRIVADAKDIGSTTGDFMPTATVIVDGFTGVGALKVNGEETKVLIRITK